MITYGVNLVYASTSMYLRCPWIKKRVFTKCQSVGKSLTRPRTNGPTISHLYFQSHRTITSLHTPKYTCIPITTPHLQQQCFSSAFFLSRCMLLGLGKSSPPSIYLIFSLHTSRHVTSTLVPVCYMIYPAGSFSLYIFFPYFFSLLSSFTLLPTFLLRPRR